MNSEAQLILNNDNFNLATGLQSFESLNLASSDRYQFIPYYDFDNRYLAILIMELLISDLAVAMI